MVFFSTHPHAGQRIAVWDPVGPLEIFAETLDSRAWPGRAGANREKTMPQVNLTTRFLDALKPTGSRVEYLDTVARGLALRVTDQGVKTWSLRYRTPLGARRRLTLGQYPDLTLKKARKRVAVERGPSPTARTRPSKNRSPGKPWRGRPIRSRRS